MANHGGHRPKDRLSCNVAVIRCGDGRRVGAVSATDACARSQCAGSSSSHAALTSANTYDTADAGKPGHIEREDRGASQA